MATIEKLTKAQVDYVEAKAAADRARRTETEALNRLNEAQKLFDADFEALKNNAPPASDWGSRRRRGEAV